MTLAIANIFFAGTSVNEFPEDAARFPPFVGELLDDFYPIVGNVHSQTIVESQAAVLERQGKARHSAHLLGNGNGRRLYLVNEKVGQREIAKSVVILSSVEVIVVASKCLAQAMTVVEH